MSQWIQTSVLYQIYPRSFYDSDSNGVGDLAGITAKLDYLRDLGIGAIWISPFYPSPMADFGYDISSYTDVDPIFGSLDDFNALLAAAHDRDIRVMIDFVPNHTSDEHPWFVESKSSRNNPKRDWYVWRDKQPDGSLPNNWLAHFGGPAWTLDEATGQYYLHSFLAKQPDLNWDNPEVRAAMANAVRYWMELGVDGLRVDAVNWLSKDPQMRDDPIDPNYTGANPYKTLLHTYSSMGPHLYEYLRDIEAVIKDFDDRFMIVESYPDIIGDQSHYLSFYRELDPSAAAAFNFEAISLPWDPAVFRASLGAFIPKLRPGDTAVYSFGNHDRQRLASRFGKEHTRTAAVLLLTLPGAPIIYYGDEIGMHDVAIPTDKIQDPFEVNNPGHGFGRDPVRTPMQWTDGKNAGFSAVDPWLPVSADYVTNNVALDQTNPRALLHLYRQLLRLRSSTPALQNGTFELIDLHPDVLAYRREHDNQMVVVALNFSSQPVEITSGQKQLLLSTHDRVSFDGSLQPQEGIILTSDN